jgi:hypothetical protein
MSEKIDDRYEYEERENITYEVVRIGRSRPGYTDTKVVYRFWPVGDGDWKLQIIDSDKAPIEPVLIPEKVIQKILNVTVKEELKK